MGHAVRSGSTADLRRDIQLRPLSATHSGHSATSPPHHLTATTWTDPPFSPQAVHSDRRPISGNGIADPVKLTGHADHGVFRGLPYRLIRPVRDFRRKRFACFGKNRRGGQVRFAENPGR